MQDLLLHAATGQAGAEPTIASFYDPATGTFSHVVHDGPGSCCAVIDPVLDYDPKSSRTGTRSADRLIGYIRREGLTCLWLLETHVHADHMSASHYLKLRLGGYIGIGAGVAAVRQSFAALFNLPQGGVGDSFDHLFADGEQFSIGRLTMTAMAVPGHTPADVAYLAGSAVFVGDTLFMPDVGTARCDFPGGCAATLHRSIRRLLDLPGDTRLYLCHDYPPAGREPACVSTVSAQRASNIHVNDAISQATFVARRKERDATLQVPALLLVSLQVNLRAGELPTPEHNGIRYLKLPLNSIGHQPVLV